MTRYTGHSCSFRNRSKINETALSKYIWSLKDSNVNHSLKWKLIFRCNSYSPASDSCNLCLTEKYYIIRKTEMATLNSRSELLSTCRHRAKFKLSNHWTFTNFSQSANHCTIWKIFKLCTMWKIIKLGPIYQIKIDTMHSCDLL